MLTSPHVFARHPHLPHIEVRTAKGTDACYWTHTHDEYSIGIIDAGQATYGYGASQAPIHAGMTVLVSPQLPHSCNPEPGKVWSYRMMYLHTPWVVRSLGLDSSGAGFQAPGFKQAMLDNAGVYRSLDRVCKAIALVANPLAIEESLLRLLAAYIGPVVRVGPEKRPGKVAVERARALICARLEEAITLEELACACEMDAYQLIRKFRAAYGLTPHAFQLDQRINLSKVLLKQGLGLADIAYRLGFADQAHFQRHFKKRHAVSPKAYVASLL